MYDDSPPPYAETTVSFSVSHLEHHLTTLPARIRAAQAQRQSAAAAEDLSILPKLVVHIEDLLSDLGRMMHPPTLAELTLIPATAVPETWEMATADQRPNELHRHARVKLEGEDMDKLGGEDADSKPRSVSADVDTEDPSTLHMDGWGRWGVDTDTMILETATGRTWWDDLEQATRLARYLQPVSAVSSPSPAIVSPPPAPKKSRAWSYFRSPSPVSISCTQRVAQDRATMQVSPEIVTFRRENELGLWESRSGWGLVVKIQMPQEL